MVTQSPVKSEGASLQEQLAVGAFTREQLAEWLLSMAEIRAFEDKIYSLFREGALKGASHLSSGQEAVPVGAIAAITQGDMVSSTHRGHGHCGAIGNLMANTPQERQDHWNAMMAELYGKVTGYCGGRGGSMHIADVRRGNLGATGIVAGNLPIATGAALAEAYRGTDTVTLCFFGEGATNTGAFHESLNMGATIFGGLPVVYICENNKYGMSVPFHAKSVDAAGQASKIEHVYLRAASYAIPGELVDGQDVLAVRECVGRAVERARQGLGPTLIEAETYRYHGHSFSDQRAYRTRDEEQLWRERDPIELFAQRLREEANFLEKEIEEIRAEASERIEVANQFAQDSPLPETSTLYDFLYVDPDPGELAQAIRVETELRAQVRPAEAAARAAFLAKTSDDPTQTLPRFNSREAQALQEEQGYRFITYGEALREAHFEEMKRDDSVICLGEDIGVYGGAYAVTRGLLDEFGPKRVIDTAISEAAVVGAAGGAAIRGLRPIAEVMYIDFITIAANQLIHNISYNRYQFGGNIKEPCVIRTEGGVGRCLAATHSESLESWFVHTPGLYVVMPSTPYDAKGLLKSAIRDDNPVLFIEHKLMYSGVMGPVPDEEYTIPLGVADIKRPGEDVTLVSYSRMVHFALAAAAQLERDGIDAEVIDLRTLNPLDLETVADSVRKTGRLIMVQECFPRASVGESVIRRFMEHEFDNGRTGFTYLDAPPALLAGKHLPIPMSAPLEDIVVPRVVDIVEAARKLA